MDLLRSTCISKVLMVGRDVFLEIRIGLHGHDVLDRGEDGLDEAVDFGDIRKLGVEDFGHKGAGGGGVVDLFDLLVHHDPLYLQLVKALEVVEKIRGSIIAHHSPPLSPISRHQASHHRIMHFNHILSVFFLAQPFLPVTHNSQNEFLAWFLAFQQLDVLATTGFVGHAVIIGIAVAA